ncbi:MAG: molybdenum cofactor guanylyltransferase MobA [Rhizobiaceae bacterium]
MTNPSDIVGVVLAGGLSRRMGEQEKSLLELGGKPIIEHGISRLKNQTSNILINANGDPGRFSHFDLPVQADTVEGFAGPLAGILAGMRWCEANAPNCRYVLSIAADTPFFPNSLAERLLAEIPNDKEAIALASSDNRRHPVFGLWSISLADDLHKFLVDEENRKVMLFVERYPYCIVDFEFETSDPFFNVNTPEDLAIAQGYFS